LLKGGQHEAALRLIRQLIDAALSST
jgi:hypothetical protein